MRNSRHTKATCTHIEEDPDILIRWGGERLVNINKLREKKEMNTETNMSQSMFSKSEIWKWKKKTSKWTNVIFTSCSVASSLRKREMNWDRDCTVRPLSTAHFFVFIIGVSPTAFSNTSTATAEEIRSYGIATYAQTGPGKCVPLLTPLYLRQASYGYNQDLQWRLRM